MIRLSLKALESFKKLYFNEYGVTLSDEEANKLGIELLELFKIVYRPIQKSVDILTFNRGSIPLRDKR